MNTIDILLLIARTRAESRDNHWTECCDKIAGEIIRGSAQSERKVLVRWYSQAHDKAERARRAG